MKGIRIIVILGALLLVSGCERAIDNAKLDAMWQLMSIEKEGKTEFLKDRTVNNHLYYCLQRNLICLQPLGGGGAQGVTRYTGDSLHIEIGLSTKEKVAPFGLSNTAESFAIEKLNDSDLVLKSVTSRLRLRKF